MSYLINTTKTNKSTYHIILYFGKFFEQLGAYNAFVNKMGLKFVFMNIDRIMYWLIKGAACDILVYKLLKIYKLWNLYYTK